jgi:glycosyltransferase involved in cell wall biosynthesis
LKTTEEFRKRKVFFIIGKLGVGGAERVVVRLLTHLDRTRFSPALVLFEKEGAFLGDVPSDVKIMDCGRRKAGGRIRWIGNFAKYFRQERPDVALSFMWFPNAVTLLARFLSRIHCSVLVSERTTILGSHEGFITEFFRRQSISRLYVAADGIVCNSEAMRRQFERIFGHLGGRVVAISNPVDIADILRRAREGESGEDMPDDLPWVVGMGRLSPEKGFDLLVRAAGMARTPFRLLILGEGKEERTLRDLTGRLGISGRVQFVGFRRNPYPLLGKASIFVLPSRYEGFPNALVEAMALGVPCVATRCPTGPEEILTEGVNGLLVPMENATALAEAIDRLLNDSSLRQRLGYAAVERVKDFDVNRITRRFEALLMEVAS